MSRTGITALLLLLATAGPALAEPGQGKKRRPLPPEYGRVVLDPGAGGKLAPVVFDHWLHRASFTCRLCHVDLGFAMKAGATGVKPADNEAGYYCGACHDGKRRFQGKALFEACNKGPAREACTRCHSQGQKVKPEVDFATFTKSLPRGRFGNGVDWEKAEQDGLVKPIDFLEDVSIKRQSITAQKDFALSPKLEGMPDIIFSHKKHTVWSGCEGCHPDIFVGVKKGLTKYGMAEIFEGKYCGACHASVAFPMLDCQRCHVKAVQ
jgi:c(7)-type cytochrome triheme protein